MTGLTSSTPDKNLQNNFQFFPLIISKEPTKDRKKSKVHPSRPGDAQNQEINLDLLHHHLNSLSNAANALGDNADEPDKTKRASSIHVADKGKIADRINTLNRKISLIDDSTLACTLDSEFRDIYTEKTKMIQDSSDYIQKTNDKLAQRPKSDQEMPVFLLKHLKSSVERQEQHLRDIDLKEADNQSEEFDQCNERLMKQKESVLREISNTKQIVIIAALGFNL